MGASTMNRDLVPLLADPKTGAPLTLETDEKGSQVTEGLLRSATGATYPVRGGIPRFVDPGSYTDNFGMQWNKFRREQLDTQQGSQLSRERFERETSWSEAELKGKWVLDAGCGAGRFAEIAAQKGARVVAMDISSAVEATAETVSKYPNVDIVQGSLLEMPFREGAFDYAYCLGVIQHTPAPSTAVSTVVKCVKPSGHFAFTIYERKPWTKLHGKYLARRLTKRVAPEPLLKALEVTMPALFELGERVFPIPLAGKVFRFASPFCVYLDQERPGWTRAQRYRESLLDTFDMLAPRYDSPMTQQEVLDVLKNMSVHSWHFPGGGGLNVVGER